MSGKIVELLFQEEDTVTVGADMFRIEPGEGGACMCIHAWHGWMLICWIAPPPQPKEEPKEKQPAAESKPEPPKEESKPAPPKEEKKEVKKEEKKEKKEDKKDKKEYESPKPVAGSRNETRVRHGLMVASIYLNTHKRAGQDEPHAPADRRAVETISKCCGLADDFQRDRHVFVDGNAQEIQG